MSAVLTPAEDERLDGQGVGGEPHPADGGTPARVSAWLALAAVVLAFVLAPPSASEFAAGEFGRVLTGAIEVDRGGSWDRLEPGAAVPDGSTLRTTDTGAEVTIRGGQLSLSRWADLTVADPVIELSRGELLLEVERRYEVRTGAVSGEGRGTWRVATGAAPRFAVYAGGTAVRAQFDGEPVAVPAYREVPITAGAVEPPRPLRYLPSDPWDERLLAEAIRIDRLLEATRRGLAVRYGQEPQVPGFYGDFARFEALLGHLPALAVVSEDGRYGPPAETLVALLVAEAIAGTGVAPAEAAERIDRLRAAGAEWGLIVREHGLSAADLDATIERAVRQRGEAVAEGTAEPVIGPPPPEPTTEPTPPPSGPGEDPEGPTDPTTPPTEPPDDPEDPEEPGTLDPVTGPVTETVDDLGSLLEEVVPGASEVTDSVNDTVEDAADTVDDLLP